MKATTVGAIAVISNSLFGAGAKADNPLVNEVLFEAKGQVRTTHAEPGASRSTKSDNLLANEVLSDGSTPFLSLVTDSVGVILVNHGFNIETNREFNDLPDGEFILADIMIFAYSNPNAGMLHSGYLVKDISNGGLFNSTQMEYLDIHDYVPVYFSPASSGSAWEFACNLISAINPDSTCNLQNVSLDPLQAAVPSWFSTVNVFPNPSNARSTLTFELQQAGEMKVSAYNIRGQEVITIDAGHLSAGSHQVPLDFQGVASGPYMLRLELQAGGEPQVTSRIVQFVK